MDHRILTGLAALLVSACGDYEAENTARISAPATAPGWSITSQGDLNTFFDCLENAGATIISAHRGGPAPGYPENALETMAAVLEDAPAIMEIDVAASSDDVLYLMHDDTLDRTTTGSGGVNDATWSDIAKLKLVDNDGNPTAFAPTRFDDALRWANGRTILQIDFKRSTRYEDVIDEINRQSAEERVILIAYSMASAQKLHRLAPNTMISLAVNSQSELNRAVASGVPADRLLGFTGTQDPRPRLFSILNNADVEVIFGTLGAANSIDRDIARNGDENRYAEIAGQGVDIIATDRPRAAQAALNAAGRAVSDGLCGIRR